MTGLLERPLHSLEQSDYQKFEKRIGETSPFPMVGLGYVMSDDGRRTPGRFLGVLEEPLIVSSDRSQDEVEGTLFRDTPTPDMLPMFFNVMSAVHPRNERRAMMLIGAPGAGKTFLGEMVGRVMSDKGPITIDCTGLNLNELFYETVLDFNQNTNFYKALEEKISQYNDAIGDPEKQESALHHYSIDVLREGLGEAFVENAKGEIYIDWQRIKHSHRVDPNDPKSDYIDSEAASLRAKEALEWVSSKEGLDSKGGNSLGMATQEGPAWQAYKEGRVLVLDELNRAKKGTHGVIHGWMQFIIGEKTHYTFRNPMQEKGDVHAKAMTFRRSEMGAGHFVFMTGNTTQDSDEVFELPEALSSRIVEERVPDATEMSWQHRICQILTGVPISTHYAAQRDVWSKDPDGFGKFIMEGRLKGEDRDIPEYQLDLLRRWPQVMEASENLAKFFFHASEIVNPDSDKYKTVTDLNALLDEIDTSFKKETSVDFRKVSYFLNRAMLPKPIVRAPDDEAGGRITPLLSTFDVPESHDDMHQKLGTNMSYAIMDWIINKTYEQGKQSLGNQLIQLATDCGIVEAQFFEAKPSNRKSLKTLLDNNPFDSQFEDVRAQWTRDVLVTHLREEYDGKEFAADNDDVLPVSVVQRALAAIKEEDKQELDTQESLSDLVVLNTDLSSVEGAPLVRASTLDAAPYILKNEKPNLPDAGDLLSQESFLRSLAAPDLRNRNLSVLWNTAVTETNVVAGTLDDIVDEALAIAEMTSDTFIAATTVMAQTKDHNGTAKVTPVHVMWNQINDRVLVVGEGEISGSLKSAFNNSNVLYVDRLVDDAERKVMKGIVEIVGAEHYDKRDDIKKALLVRSSTASDQNEFEMTLNQILADKKTVSYLPNYLLKPNA